MIADGRGWRQFHEENGRENRVLGVMGEVQVIVFGRSADLRARALRHRVLRKLDSFPASHSQATAGRRHENRSAATDLRPSSPLAETRCFFVSHSITSFHPPGAESYFQRQRAGADSTGLVQPRLVLTLRPPCRLRSILSLIDWALRSFGSFARHQFCLLRLVVDGDNKVVARKFALALVKN